MSYAEFLTSKSQAGADSGFDPVFLPSFLFDFQASMVDWAVRKGRAAIFADCGLGKTPMGLVWASNVARKTSKPVLYLTPLAVAAQTIREAHKFDIDATHSRDGSSVGHIVVANYERLHHFKPEDFGGVVCDECPVILGRRGIGAELKASYYRQAVKNVQMAAAGRKDLETSEAFDFDWVADES